MHMCIYKYESRHHGRDGPENVQSFAVRALASVKYDTVSTAMQLQIPKIGGAMARDVENGPKTLKSEKLAPKTARMSWVPIFKILKFLAHSRHLGP